VLLVFSTLIVTLNAVTLTELYLRSASERRV